MIIFDFDGVIVDSEVAANEALSAALFSVGHCLSTDECMSRYCGRRWSDCVRLIQQQWPDVEPAELTRCYERELEQRLEAIHPIEGVIDFVKRWQSRELAIVSSSSTDWIGRHLQRYGIEDCFGGRLFSATSARRGKPFPDVYLNAADRLAVRPADCLVVEDHPLGVNAARAAGMDVVRLLAATHLRLEEPEPTSANFQVRSYAELDSLLVSLGS